MQYANYANVVKAVNCYDDVVLYEAQQLALAICAHNDSYCTDALHDALNESYDDMGRDADMQCWQHKQLREAVDLYNEERAFDALRELAVAMLVRSSAWEQAFT